MKKYLLILLVSALWIGCSSVQSISNEIKTGQQEKSFQKELVKNVQLNYLLYLPENYVEEEKFPLMIFLHGSGERGDDLEKVKMHGPPKLVEQGENLPFVIISPQCPEGERWTDKWYPEAIISLIDEIAVNYKIDNDRIYLTGLSMGGFGTWEIASLYPEKFAAITPICGGGNPEKARDLRLLPIWVFHGAKDDIVPPMLSQQIVDELKLYNSDVKFTLYSEANHNSWDETYNNRELYSWLLKQKRQERKLIKIKRENISASSGYAFYAFDKNQQTRWESKYEDPQWITIKFDNKIVASKISILWENAFSKKYSVFISEDGNKWQGILSELSGDGFLDLIKFPESEIQFIRFDFWERGTEWGNSIWEIEIE
ncbi:MAG: discoidin domain-containing protein [Melioribacteraceae bacterium]